MHCEKRRRNKFRHVIDGGITVTWLAATLLPLPRHDDEPCLLSLLRLLDVVKVTTYGLYIISLFQGPAVDVCADHSRRRVLLPPHLYIHSISTNSRSWYCTTAGVAVMGYYLKQRSQQLATAIYELFHGSRVWHYTPWARRRRLVECDGPAAAYSRFC